MENERVKRRKEEHRYINIEKRGNGVVYLALDLLTRSSATELVGSAGIAPF